MTTDLQPAALQSATRKPRIAWLGLIVLLSLATLMTWVFLRVSHPRTRLVLRACFQNAAGLQENAPVRLAGVFVGLVSRVQARPEDKNCLAEIEMKVDTPYELKIPSDSTASIETTGVLGSSFLEIHPANASGPPVQNGGTLLGRPTPEAGPVLQKILDKMNCGARDGSSSPEARKDSALPPPAGKPGSGKARR